ncbi:MAG: RNA polymerase sigma factor [Candidatus Brocadiaceae bacterium]
MDELSDDELVLMYCEGDADAFDTLFDRYHVAVYNFARMMLDGSPGAEDVLQETFMAVARAAGDYTPRGRFRAWIMRIARNRCLNRIEATRRRRDALGHVPLEVAEPASSAPRPPERLQSDERLEIVRRLVADLPERQREAIALYAYEGMAYREIAQTLDVPINTVKTLIHRGRATLARRFEDHSAE